MSGFFLIKSRLSGQFLDVSRGGGEGSQVITYKRNDQPNQLWYDHEPTGTIRSKCNNLCMEIRANQLIVNHLEPSNMNQQWERNGDLIRNRMDHSSVIEIIGASAVKDSVAGNVGESSFNNGLNQQWEFVFVGGVPPTTVEHAEPCHHAPASYAKSDAFYLVSEKNSKVLDIMETVAKDKKTKVIMVVMKTKVYPPPKSQLWYTTVDGGLLHSALNDMVFVNASSGSLALGPYKPDKNLQWKIDGKKIVNGAGNCLDIRGDNDKEGAEVCAYKYKGDHNQHWTILHV